MNFQTGRRFESPDTTLSRQTFQKNIRVSKTISYCYFHSLNTLVKEHIYLH